MVIVIIIMVLIIIYWIIIYNKLNQSIIKIDEADSGIDVALNKRYDALTKLLDTVKGYAKHEQETLSNVIELRKNMNLAEKIDANNKMTEEIGKINVLVENYPELKASQNYIMLQKGIIEVEEHLQAARRLYNSNVSSYNQLVVSFPSSIVASANGKVKKDFFKVEEEKKEDVKMDF